MDLRSVFHNDSELALIKTMNYDIISSTNFFRQRLRRKSKLELLSKENGPYYNEVDTYTKDKPEQEYVEMDTQKKPLDDLC